MIEVEQKFILKDGDKKRLLERAEFLSEKVFTDIYYDKKDYSLTLRDKWLRERQGKWELKIPAGGGKNTDKTANQYKELETEEEIRENLNLPGLGALKNDLLETGYFVYCQCTTTRKKYKKDDFIIDLDDVEFPDFFYKIGEIELMVNDENEIAKAIERINKFVLSFGLKILPVRGKVIEYLKQKSPNHYRALVSAGQVKDY